MTFLRLAPHALSALRPASFLVVLTLLAACGSATELPSGENKSAPTVNTGGNDSVGAASGGTCKSVAAADYDSSCTTDSDCVAVPPGGDFCHPCELQTGSRYCDLAAVSSAVATQYRTDLKAAITQAQSATAGTPDGACASRPESCPIQWPAACVQGKCAVDYGFTHACDDAGGTCRDGVCSQYASVEVGPAGACPDSFVCCKN